MGTCRQSVWTTFIIIVLVYPHLESACKSHRAIANEKLDRIARIHHRWLEQLNNNEVPKKHHWLDRIINDRIDRKLTLLPLTLKFRQQLHAFELYILASDVGRHRPRPNHDARIAQGKTVDKRLTELKQEILGNLHLATIAAIDLERKQIEDERAQWTPTQIDEYNEDMSKRHDEDMQRLLEAIESHNEEDDDLQRLEDKRRGVTPTVTMLTTTTASPATTTTSTTTLESET